MQTSHTTTFNWKHCKLRQLDERMRTARHDVDTKQQEMTDIPDMATYELFL